VGDFPQVSKALVAVKGETVDEEAVKLSCTLAKVRKGKVYVVYVIEVKRALPLDAEVEPEIEKGEQVLKRAERAAHDAGYSVETELLQAREAGPAIVDEAVERSVDTIFMGMPYKKRFGEFELGTAVPYILKNAPCRVLLWRETVEADAKEK
jgi:nucleotide-binding universal stress UspA family protein